MKPPSQRGSSLSYSVPSSDDALAFSAPEPSATSTETHGDTGEIRHDGQRDVAAHDHHAAVEDGAFHSEYPVGDPAAEHGGQVDQPAVGADDAGCGGLRQLEAAIGERVVEVVAQDREHPVEREPLPQLDAEQVGQADRMAEHRPSGGPAFESVPQLSWGSRCHAVCDVGARSKEPVIIGKGTGRRTCRRFLAAQHISMLTCICRAAADTTPGEPAHAGACKVTPKVDVRKGGRWTPYSAYR